MGQLTKFCTAILLALSVVGCLVESPPIIVPTATSVADTPPIIQTVVVTATPGPAAPPIIHTVVVTATPPPTSTPRPTLETMAGMGADMLEVQEISIIENYTATRFWPSNIVVIKDVPVRLYLTRLHREHINRFTINPFFSSTKEILPGTIGIIEFIPDQLGEFKISNVGHGFAADLIVVETRAEANQHVADRGIQMYALIHDVDQFRLFPETIVVQKDIPVTIHNISLVAEHQVSIEPFELGEQINVRPRVLTRFEFTPDTAGEFTILHKLHGFTGTLIVEGGP